MTKENEYQKRVWILENQELKKKLREVWDANFYLPEEFEKWD